MTLISILRHRWLALVILISVTQDATAFGFGKKANDLTTSHQQYEIQDLVTRIRPVPDDQSGVYSQALEILTSLQASPSCNRLATLTLLGSCQSIDGTRSDSDGSLDDVRSIYAAQLAMCEIMGADAPVPSPCRSLAPDPKTDAHRDQRIQGARKAHLSSCLQTLESRPQWWTSYSNSRQNAVVICRAARVDVDKDELIKLYKASVQTHRDAGATLARATEYAAEELKQQHADLAIVKKAFQDRLLQDIEAASGRTQSYFNKLIATFDAGVQTIFTRITSATRNMETDVASLRQNILSATTKSRDLEKNVGRVFQKAAEGSAELASVQTRHLDESSELATGLQLSLQQMRDMDVRNLVMIIRQMHEQLQITSELVTSVSTRQNDVADQIARLDQSMTTLQTNAQSLREAQLHQATTQKRLHEAMELGMNASLGRLVEIEGSAGRLQAAVQEASHSIAQIASLAWIVSSVWTWGSLAVLLALVVFGLLRMNARFAGILFGATGAAAVIKYSGALLLDLVHGRIALVAPAFFQRLVIVGTLLGILISLGLFYQLRACQSRKSRFRDTSDIHFLRLASSERKIHHTWSV